MEVSVWWVVIAACAGTAAGMLLFALAAMAHDTEGSSTVGPIGDVHLV